MTIKTTNIEYTRSTARIHSSRAHTCWEISNTHTHGETFIMGSRSISTYQIKNYDDERNPIRLNWNSFRFAFVGAAGAAFCCCCTNKYFHRCPILESVFKCGKTAPIQLVMFTQRLVRPRRRQRYCIEIPLVLSNYWNNEKLPQQEKKKKKEAAITQ